MHRDAGTTAATDPGRTTHQHHEELEDATSATTPEPTPRSEEGPRTETFTGKRSEGSTPNRQHRNPEREQTADQAQLPGPRPQRSPIPKGTLGMHATHKTAGGYTSQTPEDESCSDQEESLQLRPRTSPQVTYDNETTIANRRDQTGQNFSFIACRESTGLAHTDRFPKHWQPSTEPKEDGITRINSAEARKRTGARLARPRHTQRGSSRILLQPRSLMSLMRRVARRRRREEATSTQTAAENTSTWFTKEDSPCSASEALAEAEDRRPRSPGKLAAVSQGGEEEGEGNVTHLDSASEVPAAAGGQRPRSPEILTVVRQGGEEEQTEPTQPTSASEAPAAAEDRRPRAPEILTEVSQGGEEECERDRSGTVTIDLPSNPPEEMTARVTMARLQDWESELGMISPQNDRPPPLSRSETTPAVEQEAEETEPSDAEDTAGESSDRRREDARHAQDQAELRAITSTRRTQTSAPSKLNTTPQSREGSTATSEGHKATAAASTSKVRTADGDTGGQSRQGTLAQYFTTRPAPEGFTLVTHDKKAKKAGLQDAAAARDPKDPRSVQHRKKSTAPQPRPEAQQTATGTTHQQKKKSKRNTSNPSSASDNPFTHQQHHQQPQLPPTAPAFQSSNAGGWDTPISDGPGAAENRESSRHDPDTAITPLRAAKTAEEDKDRQAGVTCRRADRDQANLDGGGASISANRDSGGDNSPNRGSPGGPSTKLKGINRAVIISGIPSAWARPKVLQALDVATKQVAALAGTSRTFAEKLARGDWVVTHRTPEDATAMVKHGNRIHLHQHDGKRAPVTVRAAGGEPGRPSEAEATTKRSQLVCRLPLCYGRELAKASQTARDNGTPALVAQRSMIQNWLGERPDKVKGSAMGLTGAILLTFNDAREAAKALCDGVTWLNLKRLTVKGIPRRPRHRTPDQRPPETLTEGRAPATPGIGEGQTDGEPTPAIPRSRAHSLPITTIRVNANLTGIEHSNVLNIPTWVPPQRQRPEFTATVDHDLRQPTRHEGTRDRDDLSHQVEEAQRREVLRGQGATPPARPQPSRAPTQAPRTGSRPGEPTSTKLSVDIITSIMEATAIYDIGPPTQNKRTWLVHNCVQGILRAFEALEHGEDEPTPAALQSIYLEQTNGQTVRGNRLSDPPG